MLSGCQTVTQQQHTQDQAKVRTHIMRLQSDVERLGARMDGVQEERTQLFEQVGALQQALNDNTRQLDQRVAAVEAGMMAVSDQQKRDKTEIVKNLSKQMASIVQEQRSTATAHISSEGYEHVVKAGQTLSEIASAYGVTPAIIVRANKMKNANMLRVGQVLFIPE
jgi:nucleoid-associated protein YgaU